MDIHAPFTDVVLTNLMKSVESILYFFDLKLINYDVPLSDSTNIRTLSISNYYLIGSPHNTIKAIKSQYLVINEHNNPKARIITLRKQNIFDWDFAQ